MSEKIWSDEAWEDYLYWQLQDKKTLKRILQLDIDLHGSQFLQTFQDRFPILLQCTDIDPLHLHDCHIHIPPFLFFQSTPMM